MTSPSRLLLAGGLVAVVLAGGCSGPDGEGAGAGDAPAAAPGATVPTLPAPAASIDGTFRDLPVGFTAEGYPFIGNPDAPVSVIEFSDYLCPFCARHTTATTPLLLEEYARPGSVNFEFRDFPLISVHPTAPNGHIAAQCIADQDAALFWEYHGELFAGQSEWSQLTDPSGFLEELAVEVGADASRYSECVASGRMQTRVSNRMDEGQREGFNGTPSFRLVVNATGESFDLVGAPHVDQFREALDVLLRGGGLDVLGTIAGDATVVGEDAGITFTVDPLDGDRYMGFEVGFTSDGLPYVGAAAARVTVIEFSDYGCPFCFRHTTQTAPELLDQYAALGDVQFVFHDYPLAELHPTAPQAHAASVCASEQGAPFFWAYHDTLFFNQQEWAGLADPTDYLAATAAEVGADTTAFASCLDSGRTMATVDERVTSGRNEGFDGTPSFRFVDNESGDAYDLVGAQAVDVFQAYLDAMLAGEPPPGAVAELPFWADGEGLQPDPDRPGYTLAGDAFKGDADAPVVVVEFSDFQCPACGVHALETQPAVDEALVTTGQIMWVFKHLPSASHPQAPIAAAAAECAGDQGRFWEMHDLLFATVAEWTVEDSSTVMEALAEELAFDDSFAACLAGRAAFERVLQDVFEAEGVVDATPTFIVIYGGQGRRIVGTRSAEEFVTVLQEQVELAVAAAGG